MKKIVITLIIIGILVFCGISQIALFSEIYGKEGILLSGMATLNSKDPTPVVHKSEPIRNMDPGNSCGNSLCEINEYHYNCPQDC
ncbi:MAG: hypothetical protein KKA65_02245 [Nanoarchaeota archaeon]|nr:hypothetical protein [Nanoarchaeota archaeon]MBU4351477.1 hypothetical protein [Nanoarchaeota archaeon]MBU4456297.1 hypothetical protein [Nanoarchaeota archaeon]MCG2719512.1 hypothetical protein [Nanoarchaeota archaeon]